MVWILAFLIPLVAGAVHAHRSYRAHRDLGRSSEIVLRYLCAGLFGFWMITAGLFHVLSADSVAAYIGWPAGSPFQLELGFAAIGLGLVALRLALLRDTDLLAAWLGGSVFYLGAAAVHAMDMLEHGNFHAGNAGPVFYVDILAPIVAFGLWLASTRGRGRVGEHRAPAREATDAHRRTSDYREATAAVDSSGPEARSEWRRQRR